MLSDMYKELIMDHNRSPRNFCEIKHNRKEVGDNPLCGDYYTVYLNVQNNIVEDISFTGVGCAISKASASLMTSIVKGKSIEEVKDIYTEFDNMVKGMPFDKKKIGSLISFENISNYPSRLKCVVLSWYALKKAINI